MWHLSPQVLRGLAETRAGTQVLRDMWVRERELLGQGGGLLGLHQVGIGVRGTFYIQPLRPPPRVTWEGLSRLVHP